MFNLEANASKVDKYKDLAGIKTGIELYYRITSIRVISSVEALRLNLRRNRGRKRAATVSLMRIVLLVSLLLSFFVPRLGELFGLAYFEEIGAFRVYVSQKSYP